MKLLSVFLLSVLISLLASCSDLKTDFKQAFGKDQQPIRESVRYLINRFEKEKKEYYKGPKTIRIGMSPLQENDVLEDGIYLDPHRLKSEEEVQLAHFLYATLCTLDPKTGKPVAMLAESWTISEQEDGRAFVFVLKEIYWREGRFLSAEQVKSSLLRLLDPRIKNPYAATLALSIKGGATLYSLPKSSNTSVVKEAEREVQINVVDTRTLRIIVNSLSIDLLKILAHPSTAVLPIATSELQDKELFNLNPATWIGIGAFIPSEIYLVDQIENDNTISKATSEMESNAEGRQYSQLYLTRRKAFWKKPWLENIEIIFIESEEERIARYRNDTLDWVYNVYKAKTSSKERLSDSEINSSQALMAQYIEFASMLVLDIPAQSRLRKLDTQPSNGIRSLKKYIDYLVDELYELEEKEFTTLAYKSNRIFMPNMVVYPQTLTQETVEAPSPAPTTKPIIKDEFYVEEIEQAAKELNDGEQESQIGIESTAEVSSSNLTTNTNFSSNNELTIPQIIRRIKQHFVNSQNKSVTLRVAYQEKFLLPYAVLIEQILNANDIDAEIIEVFPEANLIQEYDIAIRNIVIVNDLPVGMLSRLWWLFLQEQDFALTRESSKTATTGVAVFENLLIDSFTQAEDTHNYLTLLNSIEQVILKNSRFVPLWNLPKRELINTEEFSWWTPQMLWHPLFP